MTRTNAALLLALTLTASACDRDRGARGSGTGSASPQASASVAGPPLVPAVQALRNERQRVLRAKADEVGIDLGGTLPLEPLLGMSRVEIAAALGEAEVCISLAPDGGASLGAPCATAVEWRMWFFNLPPGWRGGGTELWLTFDAAGICTTARWGGSR